MLELRRLALLGPIMIMSLISPVAAEGGYWSETKTDKFEIQKRLEQGGWKVAYGQQVRFKDQAEFSGAAIADALGGGGSASAAWLTHFLSQQVDSMLEACKASGLKLSRAMVEDAIRKHGHRLSCNNLDIDVGVNVYHYSEVHHFDWKVPFDRKIHHERQEIPQPPEYQIYFRYRIKH